MGYDMWIVDAAGQDVDGDRDDLYYRLNIWGMGKMRETMAELGMLAVDSTRPPFPAPEAFGLTDEDVWEERTALPGYAAFRAAHDAVISWAAPDEPGIALHKFGSNDGWWVTAPECAAALALARTADETLLEQQRASWKWEDADGDGLTDWLAFLERAEKQGGFRVY